VSSLASYGRHLIDDDDVAAVAAVLRSDFLTNGPAVAAFEDALAQEVGARFAASCSSGTAALHLAMMALGVGEGDSVIVPTVTFLATANAARYVGAEVIFADVDPETGLMGESELRKCLGATRAGTRAKAVIPVHLNGQCAEPSGIRRLADERGLVVVEDASHSLGTSLAGAGGDVCRVGDCSSSAATVFSFHAVKTVAMGEGGAITTNDAALDARIRLLRSHGMNRNAAQFDFPDQGLDESGKPNPWYYELSTIGFNYRASDIHCALGLSQLRKLGRFVSHRRRLLAAYDRLLTPLAPWVRPVGRVDAQTPAWHLCVALIDFAGLGVSRARTMNALRERGIASQVHYLPVHRQPYYRRRYGEISMPGADLYYSRCLSLPLHAGMTESDVEVVVGELRGILGIHGQ
jgi:UDP-4-amino-4,6-dideoxy-N-acetyl-beta-L-altrosamine transaminase